MQDFQFDLGSFVYDAEYRERSNKFDLVHNTRLSLRRPIYITWQAFTSEDESYLTDISDHLSLPAVGCISGNLSGPRFHVRRQGP